jgi:hypothetical protein
MHNKKTLDARADPGDSVIERDFGMDGVGVACIAHEQAPNRRYELKVLKQQLSSDLEYLTIQMRSTHHSSSDSLQDC